MRCLLMVLATSAAIAPAMAVADSWPGSRPQVYASSAGTHRFKTRPPQLSTWSGKSQGTLVTVAADGRETPLWTAELVNIPVVAYVTDDGKSVVTLDTWARLGYEHALVVYGDRGTVVADYPLDALLSKDEIASSVIHTMNARRWLQGATIELDTRGQLVITLQWGRIIRVALATGKIESPS
jgi:hypothetical protein